MSAGLLDLPPAPTTRPRPPSAALRASSDAARAAPDRDAERFSLPAEPPTAKDARDPKTGPKDTESSAEAPPKDAPAPRDATPAAAKAKSNTATDAKSAEPASAAGRTTTVATGLGDGLQADVDAAKPETASAPAPAAAPTDAATPPPATRQPGFLALMRALGIANGKAPPPASPDGTAVETAATATAPVPTLPAAAAGTPNAAPAASVEIRTTGSVKTDAIETDEVKTETDETVTVASPAPMPIMLPPTAQASAGSSPAPEAAETGTGAAPAIADQRPASAGAIEPSGLAPTTDEPSAKDAKTVSSPNGVGSKEASVAGWQPEKPSFGEHLAKATAEAIQTGAATQTADPAASIVPSNLSVPAPTPGLHAAAAHAAAPTASAHPVVSGVPISAVPVEIGMKSLQGVNRFDIRLDPDDLGQIDVRLDISETGTVRAHIVVERPEALASLQRETTHLERALEQAGFKAEDGVSLSLRQQNGGEAGNGRGDGREARPAPTSTGPAEAESAATTQPARRVSWTRASGIDRHI